MQITLPDLPEGSTIMLSTDVTANGELTQLRASTSPATLDADRAALDEQGVTLEREIGQPLDAESPYRWQYGEWRGVRTVLLWTVTQ